ncbi:MAG: hypothetical protein QT10_C0018G0005 [archaeon GW2011_AR19]|nr:MAG: hypothetical protein QT10_C0018G0005 [archaeon GW2011_AR19]
MQVKIPNIDLKELEEQKKINLKERLEFIKLYAEWIKKKSNKEWSSQQAKIVD